MASPAKAESIRRLTLFVCSTASHNPIEGNGLNNWGPTICTGSQTLRSVSKGPGNYGGSGKVMLTSLGRFKNMGPYLKAVCNGVVMGL